MGPEANAGPIAREQQDGMSITNYLSQILNVVGILPNNGIYHLQFANGSTRPATAAEILAAQSAWDAAQLLMTEEAADRAAVRAQFIADRDTLVLIINEAAWTNVKRDQALKDMAQVQRRMLRAVKSLS